MFLNNNKKVCIFVDGENLRHSIGDLFPNFKTREYLPRANWTNFFDWIAYTVAGSKAERVRTYWYVVQNIDFSPFNVSSLLKDLKKAEKVLSNNTKRKELLLRFDKDTTEKEKLVEKMIGDLLEIQGTMNKRFAGWTRLQETIAHKYNAIEFRRAGSIRYNLFEKELGSEKAVDVKLATDMLSLRDIYDVAIVVSGDQDYVPAVDAIKDFGKHTVNVSFRTEKGYLLPGGARRLNQSTDRGVELPYSELKRHLGL